MPRGISLYSFSNLSSDALLAGKRPGTHFTNGFSGPKVNFSLWRSHIREHTIIIVFFLVYIFKATSFVLKER